MLAALLLSLYVAGAPVQMPHELLAVPDASKLLWSTDGVCPNGQAIRLDTYDMDPADDEAAVKVWSVNGQPFLIWDVKAGKFYIVALKKVLTAAEMVRDRWDSPCAVLGTPA